ncbi:MAG: RNA polymerase subunit sigma [Rubinisphaera brasiliensis]
MVARHGVCITLFGGHSCLNHTTISSCFVSSRKDCKMSGPIVRTGATPEFSNGWDRIFGDGKTTKKKATKKKTAKKAAAKKTATKKAAKKTATKKATAAPAAAKKTAKKATKKKAAPKAAAKKTATKKTTRKAAK